MTLTRKAFLKVMGAGALCAYLPDNRALTSMRIETARSDAKRLKIQDVEIYYVNIKLMKAAGMTNGLRIALSERPPTYAACSAV